jgi:hypothetical protein
MQTQSIKQILADVKNGLYTHLLISPELATGPKFHTTATNPLLKAWFGARGPR